MPPKTRQSSLVQATRSLENNTITNMLSLMQPTLRTLSFAVCCSALIGMSGCQFAPENPMAFPSLFKKETPPIVPDRMMVIWTDTVLHQPQQPGIRGFGGRAYFYNGKNSEPIEVDGGLAVYAFDANNMSVDQNKPERKFVFTADQLNEHLSHGDMGPSYSIWLPWDQVGGVSRQLSLVTRFEGRNGGVVISEPTIKLLPGSKPKETRPDASLGLDSDDKSYVRTANYLGAHSQDGSESRSADMPEKLQPQRRTETIDLPPSFYRHLIPAEQPTSDASQSQANLSISTSGHAESMTSEGKTEAQPQTNPQSLNNGQTQLGFGERRSFRTSGDYQPNADSLNRTKPLQAGWIRELPRTPRTR